ncbi:MAG: HlyD family efflux transporter periplasmic adaptor subunit [Candidatus Eisenbacteria bacterium]
MKWKLLLSVFFVGAAFALLGGSDPDHGEESSAHEGEAHSPDDGHGHGDGGHPTRAVTLWTDHLELFLEYPLLSPGETGRCLVHLTDLRDFQPIREGTVTVRFRGAGSPEEFTAREVLREGIFTPEIRFSAAGPRSFTLEYAGQGLTQSFAIDGFEVYPSVDGVPGEDEGDDGSISFLKEQQWKIEFRTDQVEVRSIRALHPAVALVLPNPARSAVVASPVDGFVEPPQGGALVMPGARVRRGEEVARLRTSAVGENGGASVKASYELAAREMERAGRLRERGAVSPREFDVIEQEYLARKAGFESFEEGEEHGSVVMRAPVAGVVTSGSMTRGQAVFAGKELFAIGDPDRVLLRILLRESDSYEAACPSAIGLRIPGREDLLLLEKDDFLLTGDGAVADPDGGGIPLFLEAVNPERLLRFHQSLPVEVYTGGGEPTLAVPRRALFEEEGASVIYVQTGGESFEMRVVELGSRDGEWVAVRRGVLGGERVVTRGGYQVKLAATTAEIGHGHAH